MKKYGILIIDDEPSILEALTLILDDQGYETVSAKTGRDGIEQSRRRNFDVTVTDLRLPDMSGLDVLKAIREKDCNSRVIVITAHGTPETVVELKACGALDVLKKPFVPSDILSLIESALKDRFISQQNSTTNEQ
jgi:DNA-binding NtrC family response regulator